MNQPVRAPLQEPIRHFHGAHAGITDGLVQLRELPALAELLARAREAAAATLVLFDLRVREHHAEEEQELFTSVQRSCVNAQEAHRLRSLVDRLLADHRRIEAMWARLRPAVVLVAAGKPQNDPAFDAQVQALAEAYAGHAAFEEQEFLPLANAILGRNANHMAALDVSLHLRKVPAPAVPYI